MTGQTTQTTNETIRWQDLIVTDADGQEWDSLGGLVARAPANLDNAVTDETGRITEWDGFFLCAPGEDADWDTPRVPVDWDGLREKLGRDA